MKMTRRVSFSSGHRYWRHDLSQERNREIFGSFASPFNHGHNYVLDVTVGGEIDARTGMIINIKRVDDILQERVIRVFDGKSINDEIPEFSSTPPTLENLLSYIQVSLLGVGVGRDFAVAANIGGQPDSSVRLEHLRLEETPTLYGELDLTTAAMTLTRVYEFAASHRLHSPSLDESANLKLYGKCNNPAGHGHNYTLEVTVQGRPDPVTGMMLNIEELDAKVDSSIIERYDHKNLDVDVPELRGKITTSEVVAGSIFEALQATLPWRLKRIRLWETPRNMFEVS